MKELTIKEQQIVNSLVKLGDTLELAVETVLNNRNQEIDCDFYYNAYCL
jgi:hypothetical protein